MHWKPSLDSEQEQKIFFADFWMLLIRYTSPVYSCYNLANFRKLSNSEASSSVILRLMFRKVHYYCEVNNVKHVFIFEIKNTILVIDYCVDVNSGVRNTKGDFISPTGCVRLRHKWYVKASNIFPLCKTWFPQGKVS